MCSPLCWPFPFDSEIESRLMAKQTTRGEHNGDVREHFTLYQIRTDEWRNTRPTGANNRTGWPVAQSGRARQCTVRVPLPVLPTITTHYHYTRRGRGGGTPTVKGATTQPEIERGEGRLGAPIPTKNCGVVWWWAHMRTSQSRLRKKETGRPQPLWPVPLAVKGLPRCIRPEFERISSRLAGVRNAAISIRAGREVSVGRSVQWDRQSVPGVVTTRPSLPVSH